MNKHLDIYSMKLHENISVNTTSNDSASISYGITRVAGGWIYSTWNNEKQEYNSPGVFVPFDNEFMIIKE